MHLWSPSECRFVGRLSADDVRNNEVLDGIEQRCKELLYNPLVTSPQQFINHLVTKSKPHEETVGEYLKNKIEKMKNGNDHRLPSSNYQVYVTLLHKLERQDSIIHKPLKDLNNDDFIAFCNYLLSLSVEQGLHNYERMAKLFRTVHNSAVEQRKNFNALNYPYMNYAPTVKRKGRNALSPVEYQRFIDMDVSKLDTKFRKNEELFKDTMILMYELITRPTDVISLHENEIKEIDGALCYVYIPDKKKNKHKTDVTTRPLSKTAIRIIEKYRGQSSQGYILPYTMNEREWDYSDPKSYKLWYMSKQHTTEKINKWLKIVGEYLGLKFPLTMYNFRHTVFTHKINNGANINQLAKQGGTSALMIDKHYLKTTLEVI